MLLSACHITHITVPPLQIWLDIDNSGHYQSCVQTEKGDARMRMPEKARHVTPHLTALPSLCVT